MEVAREAALKAGEILMARLGDVRKVTFKGSRNIVTEVDNEVEETIFAFLGSEYPDVGLLGEESEGARADEGYVWIVDPLDGTRNYASGIPFFSTVVALAKDGQTLVGVNYDPSRGEMFHAERGSGAFLNDERIQVSEREVLDECVLGMDLSYVAQGAVNNLNVMLKIWPGMQTMRIMGSSALGLSYAAAGRFDLYFQNRLDPWDIAAGLLLVDEAGGVVTDRMGRPAELYCDGIAASSHRLHSEFMRKTEGMEWRNPTTGWA